MNVASQKYVPFKWIPKFKIVIFSSSLIIFQLLPLQENKYPLLKIETGNVDVVGTNFKWLHGFHFYSVLSKRLWSSKSFMYVEVCAISLNGLYYFIIIITMTLFSY
jgi:hypothetical protein